MKTTSLNSLEIKGSLKSKTLRFLTGDNGATSVEYAVMLALIIAVCVVAITAVGLATSDHWTTSQNALDSALN